MKIKDAVSDYILSDAEHTVTLIREMFPDWSDDNVICPFHEEANASLSIAVTGKAYCFGCGFRATNIIELYAHSNAISYIEARTILYEAMVNAIPEHKVKAYVKALTGKVLMELNGKRHLNMNTIVKYSLGYDTYTKRVTIPIYDKFGTCVNIRKYSAKSDTKMINQRGHGSFRLYPEEDLLNPNNKNILLVEGEFDALVGLNNGIITVTGTGGAGNWDDKYNWMFQNKNVYILYDNDDAGRQGAEARLAGLKGIAAYVAKLEPPSKKGKDLSDWWKRANDIKIQINQHYKGIATNKVQCMSCGGLVKKVITMSPKSNINPMDVCSKCKTVLTTRGWEEIR